MDDTVKFVQYTTDLGFGGSNAAINKRLDAPFNQFTREKNDVCSYVNQMRILRKPFKYFVWLPWAPAPTNNSQFQMYTPIGNQRAYNVSNNLTYPETGELTSYRNKKYLNYVVPLRTSPQLGANNVNVSNVDVNSKYLGFGIGELTNPNILTKDVTMSVDYNRWDFVDPKLVQNVDNIIFAKGVIPPGGISSRNELRNFAQLNSC